MENRAHALATGAFILLLGAVLVAVVTWFQGDHGERVNYTVVARHGVPGLNLRAPVKLLGVEVGKVESIEFDPKDSHQILVTLDVEKDAPLTASTVARLGYQGITGLSFIDLSEDPEGKVSTGAPARMELRPSLLDQLSTGGPRLMAGINDATQRLSQVLSDANQRQLSRTLNNLGEASQSVAQLAAELRPAAAALQPLAQHTDRLLLSTDATLRKFDGLASESTLLAQELRQRAQVLDQMAVAAKQLQTTTQRLELALVGPNKGRQQPLLDELGQAARAIEKAAAELAEQPQSLVFGRRGQPPGPGEQGFDANKGGR